eukprot:SM000009S23609  [mRNA]  locus=s9:995061:996626:- [translate_table: standard]
MTPTAAARRRRGARWARWRCGAAKPGNGVELLRDGSLDSYWQSDGANPHLVNIQFQRKVRLQQLALYVDFKRDESYTPSKVVVRAGNSYHDLRDVRAVTLSEPSGWVRISLRHEDSGEYLRAFLVQLAIMSNHQNGRDTHVRQIQVFGPRSDAVISPAHPLHFVTPEFTMYSCVR